MRIPLPALTVEQMREVDLRLLQDYDFDLLQLMENAGRNLAALASRMLDHDLDGRPVVVLAGRGNNGGGGLVAARHLMNWGAWVQVILTHEPDRFAGAPGHQLAILEAMGVALAWAEEGWELPPADLVVDAIVGYGLSGPPRGVAREMIRLANSSPAPVLSLDVPSGLDLATGTCLEPCVQATATLTLALPKTGLVRGPAQGAVGRLYLADIGVPPDLYSFLGLDVPPLFARDTVLPLTVEANQAWLVMEAPT